jgi:hypothetical protein
MSVSETTTRHPPSADEALALCDWGFGKPFEGHIPLAHGLVLRKDIEVDPWAAESYVAWRGEFFGIPSKGDDRIFHAKRWLLWLRMADGYWEQVNYSSRVGSAPHFRRVPYGPDGKKTVVMPHELPIVILWDVMNHIFITWMNRLSGISYESQWAERSLPRGDDRRAEEGCIFIYSWFHEPTCSLLPPREIRHVEPPAWVAAHQEDTPENRSFWKRMGFGKHRPK